MTWGDLKKSIEEQGTEDADEVDFVDIIQSDMSVIVERDPHVRPGKTIVRVVGPST